MITITLDDALINEVIAVGNFNNAQEAVVMILTDYLQQHKKQPNVAELQAMPKTAGIDFDPPRLTANLFHPGLFEQLRLADEYADDDSALLFGRNKDN